SHPRQLTKRPRSRGDQLQAIVSSEVEVAEANGQLSAIEAYRSYMLPGISLGAGARARTSKSFRSPGPKPGASSSSATPARRVGGGPPGTRTQNLELKRLLLLPVELAARREF